MRMFIRIFIFCLTLFLLCNSALAFEFKGKANLLIDAQSGRVFLADNATEMLPIASISKLMTLVLTLEAVERGDVALSDQITASPLAASKKGAQIWLEAGEVMSLAELLYAVAVGSANDASVAVAEYIAGSEEEFVHLMNAKAEELGLTSTNFVNCTGLPNEEGSPNQMSAEDVARLAQYSLTVPHLLEYVSTYEHTLRADSTQIPILWNPNKLLRRYYGVDGLKTGFTTEAGYCLATTAKRENLRLIAVTLGQESDAEREAQIRSLLDYGFRKYQSQEFYSQGTKITTLESLSGQPRFVDVIVPNDFFITVERGKELDLTKVIELKQNLHAPLEKGDNVGSITLYHNEEIIGQSPLVLANSVQKVSLLNLSLRLTQSMAKAICQ